MELKEPVKGLFEKAKLLAGIDLPEIKEKVEKKVW